MSSTVFDVFNQTFQLEDSLGVNFTTSLTTVSVYVQDGIVQTIVAASQIGAALAILLVVLILTKSEKRRLPVFMLNTMALFLTVIDQILVCLYFTGAWYTPYAYLSGDYTFVPETSKATSVAAEILALLIEVCLEASLVLQVWVVCATLAESRRLLVLFFCTIIALLAIAFRFAQNVLSIEVNIIMEKEDLNIAWLAKARDITLTISICIFSTVFCSKLGWAMYQRQKMGMKQFGPMQVIFIGGTQTLIVPAVCALLQFAKPTLRASSLILTVTAISLPMTSLWATASIERPDSAARGPDAQRKFLVSPDGSKQDKTSLAGMSSYFTTSDNRTPIHDRFHDSADAVEKDLELQELGRAE